MNRPIISILEHFIYYPQTLTKSCILPSSGDILINLVLQSIPHHGKCRNGH